MLEVQNLSAHYGAIQALHGVSLTVEEGKFVSLIGANGAGKSTLLKAISGVISASSGQVSFMGEDIGRLSPVKIVRLGLCQVPEGRQLFAHLAVRDNLMLGAYIPGRGEPKSEIMRRIDQVHAIFPVLERRTKQIAGTLSGGEQQMLAIGRALMSKPKLLLLDEPSMGLAPLFVREIFRVFKQINQDQGTTILLVEQNARAALQLADHGYVLETGRMVLEGPGQSLLKNEDVQKAYLGG
ncbi:MAG: ABC transporter ATP-binding protein [Proteobacteria bacterium]|nr:ABC transporter ATP-binding protein [Pseudomonadota bacterium]